MSEQPDFTPQPGMYDPSDQSTATQDTFSHSNPHYTGGPAPRPVPPVRGPSDINVEVRPADPVPAVPAPDVQMSDAAMEELQRYGMSAGQAPNAWAKRGSVVQDTNHYRRGTIQLQNLRQEAQHDPESNGFSAQAAAGFHGGVLRATEKARAQGLVSDNMVRDVVAMEAQDEETVMHANPFAVANMAPHVQQMFRKKMFGILFLNQICICLIAAAIVYTPLWNVIQGDKVFVLLTFFGWIYCLAMEVAIKDKYPYNYIVLALFTLLLGCFMGGSDNNWNSHSNFQMMFYSTFMTGVMFLLSCRRFWWKCRTCCGCCPIIYINGEPVYDSQEGPAPLGVRKSAMWAFVAQFVVSLAIQCSPIRFGSGWHYAASQIIELMVMGWFMYDIVKIEQRLTVDEYMMGVISFYTDFIIVAICCCCAVFCFGSTDGGAPTETVSDSELDKPNEAKDVKNVTSA